jgi:hypothetical protein
MIGYSAKEIFSVEAVRIFTLASRFIEKIPLTAENRLAIRCHELARATHDVIHQRGFKVTLMDGKYGSIEHSWLMIEPDKVILDVYSCGTLPMVQMHDPRIAGTPGARYCYFQQMYPRTDIDEDMVSELVGFWDGE